MAHPLEKYTDIRPCVVQGDPDAHTVWLKVTNQEFCITVYAAETKEEAEWMRDQLCVALEKLVQDEIVRRGDSR
jgi:hypothetical protein